MRTLLPALIVRSHYMTVYAGRRVVREIGWHPGNIEEIEKYTNYCTQKDDKWENKFFGKMNFVFL